MWDEESRVMMESDVSLALIYGDEVTRQRRI